MGLERVCVEHVIVFLYLPGQNVQKMFSEIQTFSGQVPILQRAMFGLEIGVKYQREIPSGRMYCSVHHASALTHHNLRPRN